MVEELDKDMKYTETYTSWGNDKRVFFNQNLNIGEAYIYSMFKAYIYEACIKSLKV